MIHTGENPYTTTEEKVYTYTIKNWRVVNGQTQSMEVHITESSF